jgi:hypothetical protein
MIDFVNTYTTFVFNKQILRLSNYPPHIHTHIHTIYDIQYLINMEHKYDLFIQQNVLILNLVNINIIEDFIDIRNQLWNQICLIKRRKKLTINNYQ